MMKTTSVPPAFGAAFVALMVLTPQASGHTLQLKPISRQYSRTKDFLSTDDPLFNPKAFQWNAGGPKNVKARAHRLTDPGVLKQYGGGKFPMYYTPLAENGNYVEPNGIAVRHGVCGDPKKSAVPNEDIYYSTEVSNWPVIEANTYTPGQVIEVDIVLEYYHAGHIEMRICDTKDLDDPEGLADQECFNMHQLDRASDDGDASPIDPNHRGRYIVDPPCRKEKGELSAPPKTNMRHTDYAYQFTGRWVLPDIECEHCILQMQHISGNRCKHIGYDDFNPPSWPSDCARNKEDWIDMSHRWVCGESGSYPEEFWQCSDIRISRAAAGEEPPLTPPISMPNTTSSDSYSSTISSTLSDSETSSSTATTAEPVMPVGYENIEAEYMGCHHDNKDDRVLGDMINSDDMTPDVCLAHCTKLGAEYMALQFGFECWCSNDSDLKYERHYELVGADPVCDTPCLGDEKIACGGFDAFDLYKLASTPLACSGDPVKPYEQCGGDDGYDGSTCCDKGYECVEMAACYSQCREII